MPSLGYYLRATIFLLYTQFFHQSEKQLSSLMKCASLLLSEHKVPESRASTIRTLGET